MINRLTALPADPLFKLFQEYQQDQNPQKMNLGIGVFVTEAGDPYVMPSIQRAASATPNTNYNYTPLGGDYLFLQQTVNLLFGDSFNQEQIAKQATCGGTHACALLSSLAIRAGYTNILIPEPTWINHKNIFSNFKQLSFQHLSVDGTVNIAEYRRAIQAVIEPTILLLHGGSTHNPTGINFTLEQIRSLIEDLKAKPILVFIDFAYLGLGNGIDEDSAFTRLLFRELEDVAVGLSFSKNATLYCHRTGALFVKTNNVEAVESNLKQIVRSSISSAPAFGQMVLKQVFSDDLVGWKSDIEYMRLSTNARREALLKELPSLSHLQLTRGLFGLLKLTPDGVSRLRSEFAIYLPADGRINFSGIISNRIDYLIEALKTIENSRI